MNNQILSIFDCEKGEVDLWVERFFDTVKTALDGGEEAIRVLQQLQELIQAPLGNGYSVVVNMIFRATSRNPAIYLNEGAMHPCDALLGLYEGRDVRSCLPNLISIPTL